MPTYAFTFKKQSHPRHISYLHNHHMKLINENPDVTFTYHYEEDSHGIIHTHGIAHSPYFLRCRNIHPGVGWTVDFKILRDPEAWRKYIAKDKYKESELINRHVDLEASFVSLQKVQGERDSVSPADIDILNDDVLTKRWKSKRIV